MPLFGGPTSHLIWLVYPVTAILNFSMQDTAIHNPSQLINIAENFMMKKKVTHRDLLHHSTFPPGITLPSADQHQINKSKANVEPARQQSLLGSRLRVTILHHDRPMGH
jgi:hypothetical protein